jgi:signal transduction histidine kinase
MGLPVGLFYFVALLLGFALGLGFSVVWIGIPLLFVTIQAVSGFATLERWASRTLVGVVINEPREIPPKGASARARFLISRAVFWKALTFLTLKWIVGLLVFAIMVVLWTLTIVLIGMPFCFEQINIGAPSGQLAVTRWQALALSVVGLGSAIISARITNALAQGTAHIARFMLTDHQDEAEGQRLKLEAMALASNAALLASKLAVAGDFTTTLERVLQSACQATSANGSALIDKGRIGASYGFSSTAFAALQTSGALEAAHRDWGHKRLGARGRVVQRVGKIQASAKTKKAEPWPTLAIVGLQTSSDEVLIVAFPHHRALKRSDLEFLEAIADQVGVGLENARLIQSAQNQAALEERHRLARELHDSVSQALYGIALGARTAKAQLSRDPTKISEPLEYVLQLAEAGLSEMRALIFELRPEALETEGLVVALRKQAQAVEVRHKLPVQLELSTEPELPLETKQALLRIAQEALHNTVKHAQATQAHLKLQISSAGVKLEVGDNGVGFDASQRFDGHLGQQSMRERAANIGAQYTLKTAPGSGTNIQVWLQELPSNPITHQI